MLLVDYRKFTVSVDEPATLNENKRVCMRSSWVKRERKEPKGKVCWKRTTAMRGKEGEERWKKENKKRGLKREGKEDYCAAREREKRKEKELGTQPSELMFNPVQNSCQQDS